MKVVDGEGEAELLFRTWHPAVGEHTVEGYHAALRPWENAVVLGTMDGRMWTELARPEIPIENEVWYEITIRAAGPQISVHVIGKPALRLEDGTYAAGMAGVRIADVHAQFDEVEVVAAER